MSDVLRRGTGSASSSAPGWAPSPTRSRTRPCVGYEDLPGFPRPTVARSRGRAVIGTLAGVEVVVLQGRAHLYEGGDPAQRAAPVRALAAAGVEVLVLTNAAGSLRPEVGPGSLMAIADHINLPAPTR